MPHYATTSPLKKRTKLSSQSKSISDDDFDDSFVQNIDDYFKEHDSSGSCLNESISSISKYILNSSKNSIDDDHDTCHDETVNISIASSSSSSRLELSETSPTDSRNCKKKNISFVEILDDSLSENDKINCQELLTPTKGQKNQRKGSTRFAIDQAEITFSSGNCSSDENELPTQFVKANQSDLDFLNDTANLTVCEGTTQMEAYRKELFSPDMTQYNPTSSATQLAKQIVKTHQEKIKKVTGYDKNIDTSDDENESNASLDNLVETSDEEFINDKSMLTQYPMKKDTTPDFKMTQGPVKTRRQRKILQAYNARLFDETNSKNSSCNKKRRRVVFCEDDNDSE